MTVFHSSWVCGMSVALETEEKLEKKCIPTGGLEVQRCIGITRPPWCEYPCCVVALPAFAVSMVTATFGSYYVFHQTEQSHFGRPQSDFLLHKKKTTHYTGMV